MGTNNRTKAVSRSAALSIVLAALVMVVSPLLNPDCGEDPGHFVVGLEAALNEDIEEVSATRPTLCHDSTDPSQQEGQTPENGGAAHIHAMDNHAISGLILTVIEFGNLTFSQESSLPPLQDATVQPPTDPPRFST